MTRLTKFALPALTALALAGGVAFAAGAGGGDARSNGSAREPRAFPPPPGPPPVMGDLAYGELHVVRDGNEVVVRIDRGKVSSVSSSEIRITESNGDEVTIPVDDSTNLFAGPFGKATLDDIHEGDTIVAHRVGDGAAEFVAKCPPKPRGLRFRRPPGPPGALRRAPLPAPPGAGWPAPPGARSG